MGGEERAREREGKRGRNSIQRTAARLGLLALGQEALMGGEEGGKKGENLAPVPKEPQHD
jgi:hypothetical protein